MKISPKEYQAIANVIAGASYLLDKGELRGRGDETRYIADQLAVLLAAHNPQFDRQRFLIACKVI